jgi:WD40 repeat protein
VTRISAVNTVAAAFDGENRVAILDEKNGLVVVSLKPSISIFATVPAAVTGLTDGGSSATFGAGGHLLATIVNGKVDVWDVDAGALRYTLDVDESVFSVQLAAGSDRLLTEGTTGIAVYSLLRGNPQPLYRSRGNFDKPTLSLGGDMVAWLDGDKPDQMDSVALAAPGATPGPKRSVQLSETHQGTGLNPTGIYSIAIDTQNNIAAAVREDGSVELRDLYSGSLIVSLPSSTNSSQSSAVPPPEIPGLYFSPNGDLVMDTTSALTVMSTNIRDWERDACALADRDITDQEWADWVGGGRGHPCQGL